MLGQPCIGTSLGLIHIKRCQGKQRPERNTNTVYISTRAPPSLTYQKGPSLQKHSMMGQLCKESSHLKSKHMALYSGIHCSQRSRPYSEVAEHGASALLFTLTWDGDEGPHTRYSDSRLGERFFSDFTLSCTACFGDILHLGTGQELIWPALT